MTQDSQAKVDALINAALEAFAEFGLEGTRVDAIARRAGMNKRLLYHYVGDKTALFDAAASAAVRRLMAVRPPDDDPAAWRVLCHASAVDRCPDLSGLVQQLKRQSAAEVGQRLLAGVLPEMASALVRVESGRDDGSGDKPGRADPTQPKPRIKLRPAVSSGSSSSG